MTRQISQVHSNDVARLAGVSRSAVSRAFTKGAYISPETRAKVMEAAQALGYTPNRIARSLNRQKSDIIGVVTSELDNPFYAEILQRIGELLQENGLATLLVIAHQSDLDDRISQLLSYQIDGVILTAATLSSSVTERYDGFRKPIVLLDRHVQQDGVASVVGDGFGGGRKVADLLVAGGHRHIAFMAGLPNTSSSRDREEGFRTGLAQAGLSIAAYDVGHYTHEGATEAARRLLTRPDRPDAIFCANDVMALATLFVARDELGLRIPADLAIVGYDNTAVCSWPAHLLTSVDQNKNEMAGQAVKLLLQARSERRSSGFIHASIPSDLIIRASTRPIAKPL